MTAEHEHDYRKLNEDAVFCRGCGDIKSVEPPVCTLPHYPVYPYVVPLWPWWQHPSYPTYPTWIVSTSSIDTTKAVALSDEQFTFTGGLLP